MKTFEATVVKHTGSHYLLSHLPQWAPFPAVIRGRVRLQKSGSTNPIAVGDRVLYEIDQEAGSYAVIDAGATSATPVRTQSHAKEIGESIANIVEVLPRKNYVIRRSTNLSRESHVIAANVDKCFLVMTLALPEVPLQFLDRLLVTCGVYGIDTTIVLNKFDLLEEADYFHEVYEGAGYKVLDVSAQTGQGIDLLRRELSQGINLFSGMSGVGKSSLIKALDPSLEPRTAPISSAHLQGRHTTTFYEMYPLAPGGSQVSGGTLASGDRGLIGDAGLCGGFIIDTPGIRSFGLVDVEPEEISKYFPEMLRESAGCRFTPCTHTHEPHCAVKDAVEAGRISPERYASYLGMLEESGKYR